MPAIKKLILCHVSVSACNLRCPYCFITLTKAWGSPPPSFRFSPEYMARALSKERMGGVCFMNMCGSGETLIPKEMPEIIGEILKQGHYVEVVTNGTLTQRFEEIAALPDELLSRLSFKFSFHYRELLRLDLMDAYFANIARMRARGCSFTVELPPEDALVPEIDEIKRVCLEHLGALCHLTILRDDRETAIPVLSDDGLDAYYQKWESFDSGMLNYKKSIFGVRQTDFCYAGAWSFYYDLATGDMRKCYGFPVQGNLYDCIDQPLALEAVGHHCPYAHCYNGHAMLTFGIIPGQTDTTYCDIRNRVCADGSEWINGRMREMMRSRLADSNELFTPAQMRAADRDSKRALLAPAWKKRMRSMLGDARYERLKGFCSRFRKA